MRAAGARSISLPGSSEAEEIRLGITLGWIRYEYARPGRRRHLSLSLREAGIRSCSGRPACGESTRMSYHFDSGLLGEPRARGLARRWDPLPGVF